MEIYDIDISQDISNLIELGAYEKHISLDANVTRFFDISLLGKKVGTTEFTITIKSTDKTITK